MLTKLDILNDIAKEIDSLTLGETIDPFELGQKHSLSLFETSEQLDPLVGKSVVPIFEVRCPKCSRNTGHYFERFVDVKDEIVCPHCQTVLDNSIRSMYLRYRKI